VDEPDSEGSDPHLDDPGSQVAQQGQSTGRRFALREATAGRKSSRRSSFFARRASAGCRDRDRVVASAGALPCLDERCGVERAHGLADEDAGTWPGPAAPCARVGRPRGGVGLLRPGAGLPPGRDRIVSRRWWYVAFEGRITHAHNSAFLVVGDMRRTINISDKGRSLLLRRPPWHWYRDFGRYSPGSAGSRLFAVRLDVCVWCNRRHIRNERGGVGWQPL